MKRAWNIILIVVLIVVVLGAICTGVGIVTGANVDTIYSVLDNEHHIGMLGAVSDWVVEVWNILIGEVTGVTPAAQPIPAGDVMATPPAVTQLPLPQP